jgi:hypothetical protein
MRSLLISAALLCAAPSVLAQGMDNSAAVAEQRAAIAKLAFLHGEWRGKASITGPGGAAELVQTERAGPMLGGTVLVIEGAGYAPDGKQAFNAFAVISYDSDADRYWITSWSNGRTGKFPLSPRDDGFDWETPGPGGATIKYRADVTDGQWHEVGNFERPGAPAFKFIDLSVTRTGSTVWPAAGAVSPTP